VGQYVSRGGKQYYKGDDGKLYANFQGANAARIGNTLEGKIAGGVASFLNAASAVPGAMASAFYDPTKRFGRAASADEMPAPGQSTRLITSGDADLGNDPGRMFPADLRRDVERSRPLSGDMGRAPITSPNTTFQNADDEYNRLKSQFGGTTGVSQLAGMASLPTGFTPTGGKQAAGLKDYYAAQQEVGERNIGNITESLAYKDSRYQKGGKLEQWAKANPMLAMREFNKLGYQTSAEMQGPSDQQKIRDAISGGTYYPSEGSPSPVTNPPDFGTPANAVPAPPMQQGRAVSAPYDEAQRQAAEKTLGATGMPQLPTLGGDWLSKVMASPWGQALKNTGGAMGIDYIQGIR
jgi:hypothetical protein